MLSSGIVLGTVENHGAVALRVKSGGTLFSGKIMRFSLTLDLGERTRGNINSTEIDSYLKRREIPLSCRAVNYWNISREVKSI